MTGRAIKPRERARWRAVFVLSAVAYCAFCSAQANPETLHARSEQTRSQVVLGGAMLSREGPSGAIREQKAREQQQKWPFELWERLREQARSDHLYDDPLFASGPAKWDWRTTPMGNYVTPVRDQTPLLSCVAFASIAAAESTARIQKKNPALPVFLSEAHLFGCLGPRFGSSMDGMEVPQALDALKLGVADAGCYPYNVKAIRSANPCDAMCTSPTLPLFRIDSWESTRERPLIKLWLIQRGPLVAIMTLYRDFRTLGTQVYRHDPKAAVQGMHALCIIGYDDGEGCWICKNSAGPLWGNNGYCKIAYGECGIDYEAWSVIVK